MEIGKRKDAIEIKHGIGGNAFPKDFNWTCPICGNECRAFEETCQVCEHNAREEDIVS